MKYKQRRFLVKGYKLPLIVLAGAFIGLSFYAAIESKAVSYLSDNPDTCANCHVMTPQYTTWRNSSHREVATCNDCHVPQDNVIKKYAFKAKDGLYHASVFTSRGEPQVIRMKEAGIEVVQNNCVRCHQDQVTDAKLAAYVDDHVENRTERKCWTCHQEVPHGSVHSLSSTKYYGKLPSDHQQSVPEWIQKSITNDTIQNQNNE
jgi:cytochrome c nitrite reductase small subunit